MNKTVFDYYNEMRALLSEAQKEGFTGYLIMCDNDTVNRASTMPIPSLYMILASTVRVIEHDIDHKLFTETKIISDFMNNKEK